MINVNSVANTKTAQPIVFGGLIGYTSRWKGDN